jgi:hypothetical protein
MARRNQGYSPRIVNLRVRFRTISRARSRGLFRCGGQGGDLDGALGFGAVGAEFADGGVDACRLLCVSMLPNRWRNLRRLLGDLLPGDPNPLRNMLCQLLDRELRAVQARGKGGNAPVVRGSVFAGERA